MNAKEKGKRKLIEKTANQIDRVEVLLLLDRFGYARASQIADYRGKTARSVRHMLKKLKDRQMVACKRQYVVSGRGVTVWYVIKGGKDVLKYVRETRERQGPGPKVEIIKSVIRPSKIPENPNTHHSAIIDTILKFKKMGVGCTSPRQALWPEKLKYFRKSYFSIPDYWLAEKRGITLAAVEVEVGQRNADFRAKMGRQQNRFRETKIPTLYIPVNQGAEAQIRGIIKKLKETGEYTKTQRRGRPRYKETWGESDWRERAELREIKVGISESGYGFLFSDKEMTRISVPTSLLGNWIDFPFGDLPEKLEEIYRAKLRARIAEGS